MGVRPPQNNDDEPESIEFGIAAVDERLRRSELSFPASREEVDRELGDREIPYDVHGNTVPLAEALEETDCDSFRSRQELMNELHPVFEEYRIHRSSGVFAQVRSLLPF